MHRDVHYALCAVGLGGIGLDNLKPFDVTVLGTNEPTCTWKQKHGSYRWLGAPYVYILHDG